MDYEKQRAFLARQRRRLLPAAAACAVLFVEAVRQPAPLWTRIVGPALALGLLWAAYYLPNYLGLDAGADRRTRWVEKTRWFLLLLTATVFAIAFGRGSLLFVAGGVGLHLVLQGWLRRRLGPDLRAENPPRLVFLGVVYALGDFAMLAAGAAPTFHGWHSRMPSLVVVELLLAYSFLGLILVGRLRRIATQLGFGLIAAALSSLVIPEAWSIAAVFLWTAGAAHLYAKAVQQNLANFDDLVENLQVFTGETRETVVQNMAQSVFQLAEDWRRSNPQGQVEVTAWYCRNARLYLYANCQHHLLYKHIVYTLDLLRLARGRVLDFGGGPGDFSRALARAGFDATYLDVPGDSAAYLRWRAEREHLPVKIAHELDALAGPYDAIYALDVIEHLVDLKLVIAQWRELLRPSGLLMATYFNGPNSSAPMHIDPGYDAREYLLTHGFRNVKSQHVSLISAELMRKPHFMILEKEP